MDNHPMPVPRWALLACAVLVCAWFALGAVQTHAYNRATALAAQAGRPSSALTTTILGLLDTASTLNPDRDVALLRSQALTRAGDNAAALRTARAVARDEPLNIDAWTVLGFAAQPTDPALAGAAHKRELMLAPPVPAAP